MAERKRYCPGCGERIHRANYRCRHCRRVAVPWRFYLILLILIPLAYLALRYLPII
jgi:predicted amidophosphoribosyltransferase